MSVSVSGFALKDILAVILPGILAVSLAKVTFDLPVDLATIIILGILAGYVIIPFSRFFEKVLRCFHRYSEIDSIEETLQITIDREKVYLNSQIHEIGHKMDLNAYVRFYLNGSVLFLVFSVLNLLKPFVVWIFSLLCRNVQQLIDLLLSQWFRFAYGGTFLFLAYLFYEACLQYRWTYIKFELAQAKKNLKSVISLQISSGTLGVVTDQSKCPLGGAAVTSASSSTHTNLAGIYALDLPAGNYDITFALPKYKTLTIRNLKVETVSELSVQLERIQENIEGNLRRQ